MEFFKKETHYDFMGMRRWVGLCSVILWVLSIGLLMTKGLNFGLDFTGGAQVEARFEKPVDPGDIREKLEAQGFHGVRVQQYGSIHDILIRAATFSGEESLGEEKTPETVTNATSNANPNSNTNTTATSAATANAAATSIATTTATADANIDNASSSSQIKTEGGITHRIKSALKKTYPDIEIRRTEYVGSEVGEQLFEQGGIAVLVSILATMIYIAMRFEYRLAVSAAVGLIHDAVLLLGIFSLFSFEFDLAALASVMAVLGYSLNDTIVVFDRVRENFRKVRKTDSVEIMNLSINQTLSRTIMTSWLTMLVVLALLIFGGETLFSFSIAFFIGIIIGTFSSIYVSGALALWLGLSRNDLIQKAKMVDERP